MIGEEDVCGVLMWLRTGRGKKSESWGREIGERMRGREMERALVHDQLGKPPQFKTQNCINLH